MGLRPLGRGRARRRRKLRARAGPGRAAGVRLPGRAEGAHRLLLPRAVADRFETSAGESDDKFHDECGVFGVFDMPDNWMGGMSQKEFKTLDHEIRVRNFARLGSHVPANK